MKLQIEFSHGIETLLPTQAHGLVSVLISYEATSHQLRFKADGQYVRLKEFVECFEM